MSEDGGTGETVGRGPRTGDADGLAPAAAFDLLGNEVRLGIVRELAAVRRTNWQWRGLTFAELRRAVGVDDAGNFSYHLDRLRDHFVVKDGEEYKLTFAGMRVAGAVLAGTYTDRGGPRTESVDVDCYECGRALTLRYEWEFLAVECDEHGVLFGTTLPPGAAEGRSAEDLLRLATMDARQDIERARRGTCPHCWGRTEATLPADTVVDPASGERTAAPGDRTWAEFECDRCGMLLWLPVGACVVDEPPVVALLHDHGVDVRNRSYLELPFVRAGTASVDAEDPVRVRVDVKYGDDALRLWLDERTRVVDWERTAPPADEA